MKLVLNGQTKADVVSWIKRLGGDSIPSLEEGSETASVRIGDVQADISAENDDPSRWSVTVTSTISIPVGIPTDQLTKTYGRTQVAGTLLWDADQYWLERHCRPSGSSSTTIYSGSWRFLNLFPGMPCAIRSYDRKWRW